METESPKWYVVRTKPQKEAHVVMWLCHAEIECFLPRIRSFAQVRPLFPSYLFVHADFNVQDHYRMIKYTRGVIEVLGNGEEPIPVSNEAITIIKRRMNPQGFIEPGSHLKPGQELLIRKGPFKDLVGILESVASDQHRVHVLLNLMQRQIRVEFPIQDLARA
jgi:transcription elongation factor/antiterminator RfaH